MDLLEKRLAAKLIDKYILETTPKEEFEKLKTIKEGSFIHRHKGLGRPTKRDRRRIGQFFDDDN